MPRKERSARLREGVELIQKVWTEDAVTFDGRFTQVKDLTLSPKPVQQPMPLWIGARAEKATRNAARLGLSSHGNHRADPAPWYIDELKKCGRNPDDFISRNCAWCIWPTPQTRPGKTARIICSA